MFPILAVGPADEPGSEGVRLRVSLAVIERGDVHDLIPIGVIEEPLDVRLVAEIVDIKARVPSLRVSRDADECCGERNPYPSKRKSFAHNQVLLSVGSYTW